MGLALTSTLSMYVVAFENETRIDVLVAYIEIVVNCKVRERICYTRH